jgi:hypothetical protein
MGIFSFGFIYDDCFDLYCTNADIVTAAASPFPLDHRQPHRPGLVDLARRVCDVLRVRLNQLLLSVAHATTDPYHEAAKEARRAVSVERGGGDS